MVDVYSINTSFFRLDGGAMFGVVPRVLWQEKHIPDEKNRILQAMRTLLIIDGQRNILVDTGMGNWHDQKFIDRYCLETPDFDFNQKLSMLNLSVEDITDVIVTHLHFDHAGGLVVKREDKIQLTFANATIWLQKQQWQWAQNPSAKDRRSYMETYLDIIRDYPRLHLLEGKTDITSNVSVLPFHGHTEAMQAVIIKKDQETFCFPSDLIPMADHLKIPYIMAYDNRPIITAEEKEYILQKVNDGNWLIYFYHDPIYENSSEVLVTENSTK